MIMSDVAFINAKQKVEEWKDSGGMDLAMRRHSQSQLSKTLKFRRISAEDRESLLVQQQELDGTIQALVHQRKALEADVVTKRKKLRQLEHSSRRFGRRRRKWIHQFLPRSKISAFYF
jgi:hypothetical protein